MKKQSSLFDPNEAKSKETADQKALRKAQKETEGRLKINPGATVSKEEWGSIADTPLFAPDNQLDIDEQAQSKKEQLSQKEEKIKNDLKDRQGGS